MDIDSLPTMSSEKQMHPVAECFHKCLQAPNEEPDVRQQALHLALAGKERRSFFGNIKTLPRFSSLDIQLSPVAVVST